MGVLEFIFSACTDAAFIPALYQVMRRRRHFELFVGFFQLICTFMYNCSTAFGWGMFLRTLDWHFMSDVLTLTYLCCLLVHCAGGHDENVNISLRYLAFSCAWIFKYRDSWDSGLWETLLISAYVVMAIYGFVTQSNARKSRYDMASGYFALGAVATASIFLLLDLMNIKDGYGILLGFMHISGAAAAYFLWKAVPVFDSKKDDDLPVSLASNTRFV